ncbi:MAG: glutamate racemase [Candidatus Babeliales bacterium]|jgi:glutamate racemase
MATVGVIDSGVGGLGIFKLLVEQMQNHSLVYCADNNNMPFGDKQSDELQRIAYKMVSFLIEQHNVDLIVVACNTLSVSALDFLRKQFTVPFVGVVPVVKPACEQSKVKKIAILATPMTAASIYQKDLIAKYAEGAQVFNIACPDLARLIEEGHGDEPIVLEKLAEYLKPVLDNNVDVVGLACTHYPFIRHHIAGLLPASVAILDSNEAVARRAMTLVQERVPSRQRSIHMYVTRNPENFKQIAQKLVGSDVVHDVVLAPL